MPKHILSFVWVFIFRMPGKRKAVTQPRAPKRRGRPRRGQEGDSSSSQSPVGRTLRRGQVGDSSQPTRVRLRRGQDGDSSQPPPTRGRPKRRQVETPSRQIPPTISTTDGAHFAPDEAHEAHNQGPTSDSVRSTPRVTATLSGEHASRVVSETPPHRASGIPSVDEQNVIDNITARVIQAMQTSTPLSTAIPRSSAEGPESAEVISNVIQGLFSGETGELPSDIPKPYTSVSHPLGASLPCAVKNKIWADEYINLASLLDINRQDDISVTLKKSAGQPIISLSNSSKKEIVNIDQWTRAFLIFSAVYAEKKPIEAGSLFKYIALIRDMAFQRKHWQFYDLQFRRLRTSNQSSWGDIDWELYFRGGAPQSSQGPRLITPRSSNFQQRRDVRKGFVPHGHCFEFHYDDKCSRKNCTFNHTCFKCLKAGHSSSKCRSGRPQPSSTITKPSK